MLPFCIQLVAHFLLACHYLRGRAKLRASIHVTQHGAPRPQRAKGLFGTVISCKVNIDMGSLILVPIEDVVALMNGVADLRACGCFGSS